MQKTEANTWWWNNLRKTSWAIHYCSKTI